MFSDDSLLKKIIKIILIIAIIYLIYYLVNRGKKLEFNLNDKVKIGNLEICLEEVTIIDKLLPQNAPTDYQYFESEDENKTILDVKGTVKNTTDKEIVLENEFPIQVLVGRTKYNLDKYYENEYGTDFIENSNLSKAVIKPGQTLNVHCILVARKSILNSNKKIEIILKHDPKDYTMQVELDLDSLQ